MDRLENIPKRYTFLPALGFSIMGMFAPGILADWAQYALFGLGGALFLLGAVPAIRHFLRGPPSDTQPKYLAEKGRQLPSPPPSKSIWDRIKEAPPPPAPGSLMALMRKQTADHDYYGSSEDAEKARREAEEADTFHSAWQDDETNRVPFTRIRHVAHEFGIDLENRNSVGANNADKIEGLMRQAAVDDELKVWGRKYRGPVKHHDPLVPIEPSHFEDYGFRHGCLHYEAPNEQTATGTIQTAISHPGGIEDVTYYDLEISYDDMRRILKQFSESEDNEQT